MLRLCSGLMLPLALVLLAPSSAEAFPWSLLSKAGKLAKATKAAKLGGAGAVAGSGDDVARVAGRAGASDDVARATATTGRADGPAIADDMVRGAEDAHPVRETAEAFADVAIEAQDLVPEDGIADDEGSATCTCVASRASVPSSLLFGAVMLVLARRRH